MSDCEAYRMRPCPFCGSEILHVESLAKSFDPPRVYHEWHHIDDDAECPIWRFGRIVAYADDDPEQQLRVLHRWNKRS
jgi:hypothetical protein